MPSYSPRAVGLPVRDGVGASLTAMATSLSNHKHFPTQAESVIQTPAPGTGDCHGGDKFSKEKSSHSSCQQHRFFPIAKFLEMAE